jgi:hypothetical protein
MFRLILYISQGILTSSKNRSVIHASLLLFICNIFEAAGASVESHLSAMRRAAGPKFILTFAIITLSILENRENSYKLVTHNHAGIIWH